MNTNERNRVLLSGTVVQRPEYTHSMYAERFYRLMLAVERLSGADDVLPVTVSERLLDLFDIACDDPLEVLGQLRSYNHAQNGRNRLILTVFAASVSPTVGPGNPNQVSLQGYLCRPPVYRTTPFGREITDMLVAVNRPYNKSDYIPAIVWGRNARYAQHLQVGQAIALQGRLQSRGYTKRHCDGTEEQRVAYEVSVSTLEALRDDAPAAQPAPRLAAGQQTPFLQG